MSDERHIGLLFGISHPGRQEGCGYCDDTLKAAGITTLADAYLAGARDGRALGHVERVMDEERIKTTSTGQAYVHTDDEQEGKA